MAKKVVHQQGPIDVTIDVPEGSTVAMTRDEEQYPVAKYGPGTAEVHIDEVENWAKHGWVIAKQAAASVEPPPAD